MTTPEQYLFFTQTYLLRVCEEIQIKAELRQTRTSRKSLPFIIGEQKYGLEKI